VTSLTTPVKRLVTLSLPANATRTVALPRPSGAAAALLTISASGRAGTMVWVWPAGQSSPYVATLSLGSGYVRTSRVTPIGSNGSVSIHNGGRSPVQIVVDIAGWA